MRRERREMERKEKATIMSGPCGPEKEKKQKKKRLGSIGQKALLRCDAAIPSRDTCREPKSHQSLGEADQAEFERIRPYEEASERERQRASGSDQREDKRKKLKD